MKRPGKNEKALHCTRKGGKALVNGRGWGSLYLKKGFGETPKEGGAVSKEGRAYRGGSLRSPGTKGKHGKCQRSIEATR